MRISFGFALGTAAWFTTWGPLSADDFKLPPMRRTNFCGDTSDITTVSFSILKQMQAKAPPKGPLASSRHSLHNFFPVSGKKIG